VSLVLDPGPLADVYEFPLLLPSPRENAAVAVRDDPLSLWLESEERRQSLDFLKAIRLAPTLEVCEALLRGEKVPVSRLDPRWRKAYGL
jgi:hypothetical protein